MSEDEKHNTGIGRDDDGNVDDRRIAGWIVLLSTLGLAFYGVFTGNGVATELVSALIWPALLLMGVTVAEKFRAK